MHWRIAEAKQKFSELINAAAQEPQLIYNRNQLVAAVVEAEIFQQFVAWRERQQQSSIAQAFAELQTLCVEENYVLEIPARQNRSNPFEDEHVSL
jgi:prevent-host-death family protein